MKEKVYKFGDGNRIVVKLGNIEEEKGDILVCWTAITLKAGNPSFYKIHYKAGLQLGQTTLLLGQYIKPGDAFVTIPGLVDFLRVMHVIIPSNLNLYNDTFFNIIKTLKTYREDNICRDLYLDFPIVDKKIIFDNLFLYAEQLSDFSFIFVCAEEKDFNEAIEILENRFNVPFVKRIWKKLLA